MGRIRRLAASCGEKRRAGIVSSLNARGARASGRRRMKVEAHIAVPAPQNLDFYYPNKLSKRLSVDVRFTPKSGHCKHNCHVRFVPKADIDQDYSITSSARASNVGGTVRPSIFAVVRLTTNSNCVGCTTGKSIGLAPLSIFPA